MNAEIDISKVILETDRLRIRPWSMEDLEDFYEYASVDGVGQMAGWNPHKSRSESQEIMNRFISHKRTFALELKKNKKVIGSIGIEEISFDLGEPYTSLKGREIGYVLSKEYWGMGLMPEAAGKVMEYCFDVSGCQFLQCSHSFENAQSKRVIEKCGFEFIQDYERTNKNGENHKSKMYVKMSPQ